MSRRHADSSMPTDTVTTRFGLMLLTTRLEATDALPVNAVAPIKDGAVQVPASFPKEAAAVRLLCWASSRTLDLAGGGGVAEAAMAPEACARTGLTQVLTSQAIAKAKGSVFRFFPARARRKMWTTTAWCRAMSSIINQQNQQQHLLKHFSTKSNQIIFL